MAVDLKTPDLPDSRIFVAIGGPGSGKTELSRLRLAKWDRAIIIDSQILGRTGEYPGFVVDNPQHLADELEKMVRDPLKKWRVCYRGPLSKEGPRDPLNLAIFAACAEVLNVLVLVEEADKVVTADWCPEGLYAIAHHGRRRGQALTLIARRPANLTRDLTATADEVYVWPVDEPPDLDYLKKRGFPPELVTQLPRHGSLRRIREDDGRSLSFCSGNHGVHLGKCAAVTPAQEETEDA